TIRNRHHEGDLRARHPLVGPNNTTTLLLSEDGDTLYVGARDAVLALNVSHKDTIADCPNFIRVLQFLNTTHIYACGTFAFSPRCTYIVSTQFIDGYCHSTFKHRHTNNDLYFSFIIKKLFIFPALYQIHQKTSCPCFSSNLHFSLFFLLFAIDPTFVSSTFIPDEEKIYFFFSEVGREYDFIDKFIVSRVSQVCMSDVGGQRTLQRRWTTFAKAQLLCQADHELPYNVLWDIDTLPPAEGAPVDDTLFYGIFTSQWSVNSGRSAVCSFRLTDIRSVFSGNYKVLNRDTLQWSARVQEKVANPGECGLHNASDNALRFVKENFLADDSVRPVGRNLTMVSAEHYYSHLRVQRVQAANSKHYTVLFLLTGRGMIYIGTSEGVVKVPAANCSFYWTCAQCVLARDPFCGWDTASRVSSCPPGELVSVSLNEVVRLQCPAASRLSQQLWERPNSRLSSDLYLNLEDGSLSFVATPATLGHYLCLSTENGYQQTMAIYHVKQKSSPLSQTPTSYTQPQTHPIPTTQSMAKLGSGLHSSVGTLPKKRETQQGESKPTASNRNAQVTTRQLGKNLTLRTKESGQRELEFEDGEQLLAAQATCYLKELVIVSLLLVLSLSLLITIFLYVIRKRCYNRTAPQTESPTIDSDRRTPVEQEALRRNEFLSKRSGQALQSGHASELVCNTAISGSNGHLPNTPI
uniref:Sema domain-containing protein n=1 Tax=Amphilophus citrinellus TaxID=61819 RepID=A0A3Q0SAD9_AMPCI